ncbi:IS110 family transposase [Nanoarchaeota archaeon]
MYCGIDISKNKSDVCIRDKEKNIVKEFAIVHNRDGFQELEKALTKETIIGMEVTGSYSKALFDYLRERKYKVTYVDNFTMNIFAKLHSPQVKNDKADARLIALYISSPDNFSTVEIPQMTDLKDLANLYDKSSRQLTRFKCMVKDQMNIIFPELENLMSNNSNMGICYLLLKCT